MLNADTAKQDFLSSFAQQRQRLLHHAGPILTQELTTADPQVLTRLSQTLLTSLELLKVAEEKLAELRRENAASEESFERRLAHASMMFELAPTPLLLTTSDSTIREVNRAAANLLGREPSALAGTPLLEFVPRDQQAKFRDQLALALELKQVNAWSFRLDVKRSAPVMVTTCLELIEDPGTGARALYWNFRNDA